MSDSISRQAAIETVKKHYRVDNDLLEVIAYEIEALPSAQPGWIPCSEVPDTDRNVFIARGHDDMMTVCIGHYLHDYKQWYEDRNWFAKCLYDGLYWCEMPPLPTPYLEGGQDEQN